MKVRVLSWTVVRRPPPGHPAGLVVVLVERPDGSHAWAVADGEDGLAPDAAADVEEGPPLRVRRAIR